MKLLAVTRFEFAMQARRFHTWMYFLFLLVVSVIFVRKAFVSDATYSDMIINSPFIIAFLAVVCSMFWVMVAGAVTGQIASRDFEEGTHPFVYTTPIQRFEYFAGKFLAAFFLNLVVMLAVPLGVMLAVYVPGIDPAIIGPFVPASYISAYVYIVIPNVFLGTAMQFAWAIWLRHSFASYLGSLVLFMIVYGGIFITLFFLKNHTIATFLDAFGHLTIFDMILGWTESEKQYRLITLSGPLLRSRFIWVTIGSAILVFTYLRFRFTHPSERNSRLFHSREKLSSFISVIRSENRAGDLSQLPGTFSFTVYRRQLLDIAWWSLGFILKRRIGFVFLGLITFFVFRFVPENMENMGTPLLPATSFVLSHLTTPLTDFFTPWVIIPFILIIYAGEVVWHHREAGLAGIYESFPVPNWVEYGGRLIALAGFLFLLITAMLCGAVLAQIYLGYHRFDLLMYFSVLYGLQLPEYLLFAVLALSVHGVAGNKYVAHFILFILYAFILFAAQVGIDHPLFIYTSSPAWRYTEMRGFGGTLIPWFWFKLYWTAWAFLVALMAIYFWKRGMERVRVSSIFRQKNFVLFFSINTVVILVLAGLLLSDQWRKGGYLFESELKKLQATYEERYSHFAEVPQPGIQKTRLSIELYPEHKSAEITGTYTLLNNTGNNIDTVHIALQRNVLNAPFRFNRKIKKLIDDEALAHRMYILESPLLPGDTVVMHFAVSLESPGITGNHGLFPVASNGTYLLAEHCIPAIGYQRSRELIKPRDRRKYGLKARPIIPTLEQAEDITEEPAVLNMKAKGDSFEAIVGTDAEQTAIAPGQLRRQWTENGRNYFQYVGEVPAECAIFSARYKVRKEKYNGVLVELYHHPSHENNVDRIMHSVQSSLEYHGRHFAPYVHPYIRLIENPVRKNGAHATLATIDYGELFSLFDPTKDPRRLDFPFAIMAHEMGHQWWPGQLPNAMAEGAGVITEGLAWFTAMGVVEETYGTEHLRRLRRFFRQPYPILPIRQAVPLLRALDPYASYRKGPAVMYALCQYMGTEKVNLALKQLIEKHKSGKLGLATTLDLYNELKILSPDSVKPLLYDFFEKNTIWELETKSASAQKLPDGNWKVVLELSCRKVVVDSMGIETEVPVKEWIEVGVFAERKENEDAPGRPLWLERKHLTAGSQTLILQVPEVPARAAIDPYHFLLDHITEDNYARVQIK